MQNTNWLTDSEKLKYFLQMLIIFLKMFSMEMHPFLNNKLQGINEKVILVNNSNLCEKFKKNLILSLSYHTNLPSYQLALG